MYTWINKTVCVLGLLTLGVTSCKKDEVQVTAEFGEAPALTASTANAGTLLLANSQNRAVTFNWTPYTIKASGDAKVVSPVTYTLQLARVGTNFASPREIDGGIATASSLSLTVGELNRELLGMNFPFGQPARVEVRLKTFVAGNRDPLYSAPQTLTATPFDACIAPDTWSLIGPAGVDWSTDVPLTWNCTDNAYVTRRAMNAGEFKFRRRNDWAVNLGGAGASSAPLQLGVATPLTTGNPPNLQIATAGTYTIKLRVTGSAATTAGTVTITQ